METIAFEIDIKAPREKVWKTMLDDKTYREWTDPFYPGSYYQGSWDEGSDIRFLAEVGGKVGGMLGKIVKNVPNEFVSVEYFGLVKDGVDDTSSEEVLKWKGSHENYTFTENAGFTHLLVELKSSVMEKQEMLDMFEGMWPKALQKLKELVEK